MCGDGLGRRLQISLRLIRASFRAWVQPSAVYRRVPLMCQDRCTLPLSITTVPAQEDGCRPSDDAIGTDGLLRYRYRGRDASDVNHRDNAGLREAMRRRVPLIYFHGIVEGKYEADYPVFVVGDSPELNGGRTGADRVLARTCANAFTQLGRPVAADPRSADPRE